MQYFVRYTDDENSFTLFESPLAAVYDLCSDTVMYMLALFTTLSHVVPTQLLESVCSWTALEDSHVVICLPLSLSCYQAFFPSLASHTKKDVILSHQVTGYRWF